MITVPAVLLSFVLPETLIVPLAIVLRIAATSIGWIEWLIQMSASKPLASLYVAHFVNAAKLLLLLPVLWVVLPRGWPGRYLAWLGAWAVLAFEPEPVPEGCIDIRALDVGQGLSLVLETSAHVLVYDAGPAWRSGSDAGERVVMPYLRSRRISQLDRLVISHADLDHSGGAGFLLQNLPVADLIVGETLPGPAADAKPCVAGAAWRWDGVRFTFLHPSMEAATEGNDASCVLLVQAGSYTALFPGDIEAGSEAGLVRQRVLPRVDIVSVPHHGSRTSSTGPFVRSLRPSIAIVSAGHGNRWGFPKDDVVARWRGSGARVMNTAESGSISIRMCSESGPGMPREWRNQKRRIWQERDS
jgi:competence protein ComEC